MTSFPFGGELASGRFPHFAYLTDSGRSSLRLILASGFAGKTFLLPDFLCGIIPDVLAELGASFSFYHVGESFEIDENSVKSQSFDVLYVIDYFGYRSEFGHLVGEDRWVIEDCAFLPEVLQHCACPNWIGYNSLRKTTALADGSVVLSTVPLDRNLIAEDEAPFAGVKYAAKLNKQEFLAGGAGAEQDYLDLFDQAEKMIDTQQQIHSMSAESLARYFALLANLGNEMSRRRENLGILRNRLAQFETGIVSDRPSHFVMALERRNSLRERLREQRIYLPSHWPHTHGPHNPLYDRVLAVSVDARYSAAEMTRVAGLVRDSVQ
jgi:hypothetical protein